MTFEDFSENLPIVQSMCDQFCKRFSACNYIDRNEIESEAWQCFLRVKKHYLGDDRNFRFYFGVAVKNSIYNVIKKQKKHSVLISFEDHLAPDLTVGDVVSNMQEERQTRERRICAVRRAWCSLTDDQRSRARVLLEPQKYGAVGRYAKARGESPANFSMKLCKIKRILRSRIISEMIRQRKGEK